MSKIETEEVYDWKSNGVSLCGQILMLNKDLALEALTPATDPFEGRRVFM